MSEWQNYPAGYRQNEIQQILRAVRAGESAALVGLSGAGKSNLVGFLTNRWPLPGETDDIRFALLDCNSLPQPDTPTLLKHLRTALGDESEQVNEFSALNNTIGQLLENGTQKLCLLLDRYEMIEQADPHTAANNLRALRDAFKYRLSFVLASRRPPNPESELAELFYANTLWLGPLSPSDAAWNVTRYAKRRGEVWDNEAADKLIEISWGYPSLLRAACEAYAALQTLDAEALTRHPAVLRRVAEFWADEPTPEMLEKVGLAGHPLLIHEQPAEFDTAGLTAKELALLDYLRAHANEVCSKDDLVQAIWPEDEIYESGIRDDSLAQLVRRLRVKIEPDTSNPRFIQTVPGRGYRFTP
ncbi:MAG TPA: winged helix-turn-helix domain-containing protein [Anaerolineales bacterium]|nr:winged helix-turn-helix domain-containing protein [Anaerolineales bacterium]